MFFVSHKMKIVENLWRNLAKIYFCGKDEKVSMKQESFNNEKCLMAPKLDPHFIQNPQRLTHNGVEKVLFDMLFLCVSLTYTRVFSCVNHKAPL